MKEVRYNDRLWFGKHKGTRICEIIKSDPAHIQKIMIESKITLDKKSMNLYNDRNGKRRQHSFEYRPSLGNVNVEPENGEYRPQNSRSYEDINDHWVSDHVIYKKGKIQ